VSISSTFYTCLFLYESALLSFSLITVGLEICWQKNIIGAKAARKMLMKLTTGGIATKFQICKVREKSTAYL